MVNAIHNGVFFTGHHPITTRRFARTVAALCIQHGASNVEFYDGSDVPRLKEVLATRDRRMTYFVSGAPSNYDHLQLLDEFSRGTIVHLNIVDGEGAENPRDRIRVSTVLSRVRGVTIIPITGHESEAHRLHRIFRGLRDVSQPPIHPAIAEKVLQKSRNRPEFLTEVLAMV